MGRAGGLTGMLLASTPSTMQASSGCRYLAAALLLSSATAFHALPAMRPRGPACAAAVPHSSLQTLPTLQMSAAAAMPNYELTPPTTNKLGRILTGMRFSFAAVFSVVSLYPPLLCSVAYGYLADNSRCNSTELRSPLLITVAAQLAAASQLAAFSKHGADLNACTRADAHARAHI